MSNISCKHGMTILIFVVLTGSFLLTCTGVWRTTSYLVDFAFQKQVHYQNRYFIEGIMRWAIRWLVQDWQAVVELLDRKDKITISLEDWPIVIERLVSCSPSLTLERHRNEGITLEVRGHGALEGLVGRCTITRLNGSEVEATKPIYTIQHWSVGG